FSFVYGSEIDRGYLVRNIQVRSINAIRLRSPSRAFEESRSNLLEASAPPTRGCEPSALCRSQFWEVHQSRCSGRVAGAAPECVSHEPPLNPAWTRVPRPPQALERPRCLRHRVR